MDRRRRGDNKRPIKELFYSSREKNNTTSTSKKRCKTKYSSSATVQNILDTVSTVSRARLCPGRVHIKKPTPATDRAVVDPHRPKLPATTRERYEEIDDIPEPGIERQHRITSSIFQTFGSIVPFPEFTCVFMHSGLALFWLRRRGLYAQKKTVDHF